MQAVKSALLFGKGGGKKDGDSVVAGDFFHRAKHQFADGISGGKADIVLQPGKGRCTTMLFVPCFM